MRVVPDDSEASMRDVPTVKVWRGGRDAHIGIRRIATDAGLRYWRRLGCRFSVGRPTAGEPRGAGGLLRSGQGEAPRPLHGAVLTRIGALLHRRVENPGRDAGQLIRRATPLARVERLRRRVEVRGITREAILPRCGPVAAPERDVVIVRDGTALKPIRKTCRAAAPR